SSLPLQPELRITRSPAAPRLPLAVSATRLHQTTLQGLSRLAVCPGLATAGLARRAQGTLACPMPTVQSDEVAPSKAATVRSRFGTRAASWRDPLLPASGLCEGRWRAGGQSKRRGREH